MLAESLGGVTSLDCSFSVYYRMRGDRSNDSRYWIDEFDIIACWVAAFGSPYL